MGILLSLIISLVMSGDIKANGRLYAETAIITEIEKNQVTVKCANGNLFAFYGAEDFEEGDLCSMIMYDNATPIVYDDKILSVEYAGTPAMFN